ncbi:MAG TPA: hypothetical protein DDW68_09250 [Verrucomicrobiales bacterium]|nr:hypothetical protein [Verrucomicrobiales bacterium]
MAPTFGSLAALILLFAAFVANKNKEAIEEANSLIAQEDKKFDRQTTTYDGLVSDIDGLVTDKKDADASREAKQIDLDKQLAENKATEAELASKKAEAASIEEEVASAEDKLKTVGDPRDLAPKIEALKMAVAGMEDDVALINAQVSKLLSDKKTTDSQATELKRVLSYRTKGMSQPTLRTRINSVFRNYGFVTLAGGDGAGVVAGSKLSVLNNGEEIAQLRVTAVEANSSSANIIPSSLKGDTSISIGDVVVPVEAGKK